MTVRRFQAVQTMIGSIEKRIVAQHRSNETSKRLEIPGIGVIGANMIAAVVPDPRVFRSGRDFAALIGIVSRQDSSREPPNVRQYSIEHGWIGCREKRR